ncbi:MAG TPA: ferrochelatase [Pyrinomonadaceae bacterium]|jgi:ferrochelatase|nr:ferrochelatase [Pyrinomonadaceae bacterium]
MMSNLPQGHPPVLLRKIGVLLLNLGTPEGTSYWPMRRYLSEFLSDRRVIEVNPLLWQPLLQLVILTTRPGRKGKDYEKIWNRERDEGPLKTITRAQAEKLQSEFGAEVIVDWAMRYGHPSTQSRIEALKEQGCDRILLIPLYPQYCAATTATANDKAFDCLKKMRWQPSVRTAPPWHDDEVYIEALASSVKENLAGLDFEPQVILASFHGVPEKYLLQGDPYHCQCVKTARLLREKLQMTELAFLHSFQSRFGADKWVEPYTDETVKKLAHEGVKKLAIVAPGFTADCLETLEELDVENRGYFLENGGEQFAYLPCLNDSEQGMRVITHVARRELGGWLTFLNKK